MAPNESCGLGDNRRTFPKCEPMICYDSPAAATVDRAHYDHLRDEALKGNVVLDMIIPKKSGKAWEVRKGDLCRISVVEGSQVADCNFWNLRNKEERFYSGKTRQLHATHLTVYDRLWSNLPYLRPMATIVADTLKDYGFDEDGASLHDVVGKPMFHLKKPPTSHLQGGVHKACVDESPADMLLF
ncbi:hypothetical protein C0J52_16354 [Blattella germanica]|nr:hypothetical protein C0J52_16354 [Blattella germanica]